MLGEHLTDEQWDYLIRWIFTIASDEELDADPEILTDEDRRVLDAMVIDWDSLEQILRSSESSPE